MRRYFLKVPYNFIRQYPLINLIILRPIASENGIKNGLEIQTDVSKRSIASKSKVASPNGRRARPIAAGPARIFAPARRVREFERERREKGKRTVTDLFRKFEPVRDSATTNYAHYA